MTEMIAVSLLMVAVMYLIDRVKNPPKARTIRKIPKARQQMPSLPGSEGISRLPLLSQTSDMPISTVITQPALLEVFRRAGWSQERRIDVFLLLKPLTDEGFTLFDLARDFLIPFTNLTIRALAQETRSYSGSDLIEIDPLTAVGERDDSLVEFEHNIGEKLFPMGSYIYFILYMSETGKVFLNDGPEFECIGNSLEEGLGRLLFGAHKL